MKITFEYTPEWEGHDGKIRGGFWVVIIQRSPRDKRYMTRGTFDEAAVWAKEQL